VWPHNFKLEKLKNTTARKILRTGSLFMKLQFGQQQGTSTSWPTTFQLSSTQPDTNGSLAYLKTLLILGRNYAKLSLIISSLPASSPATSMISRE